jgi:hypothetical protein
VAPQAEQMAPQTPASEKEAKSPSKKANVEGQARAEA